MLRRGKGKGKGNGLWGKKRGWERHEGVLPRGGALCKCHLAIAKNTRLFVDHPSCSVAHHSPLFSLES